MHRTGPGRDRPAQSRPPFSAPERSVCHQACRRGRQGVVLCYRGRIASRPGRWASAHRLPVVLSARRASVSGPSPSSARCASRRPATGQPVIEHFMHEAKKECCRTGLVLDAVAPVPSLQQRLPGCPRSLPRSYTSSWTRCSARAPPAPSTRSGTSRASPRRRSSSTASTSAASTPLSSSWRRSPLCRTQGSSGITR